MGPRCGRRSSGSRHRLHDRRPGDAAGGSLPCTEHVAKARAAIRQYGGDFEATEIYSCDRDAPIENGRKVCHVSLLVTDKGSGARAVMDNGHVLLEWPTGEFSDSVDSAWEGEPPSWVDVVSR